MRHRSFAHFEARAILDSHPAALAKRPVAVHFADGLANLQRDLRVFSFGEDIALRNAAAADENLAIDEAMA